MYRRYEYNGGPNKKKLNLVSESGFSEIKIGQLPNGDFATQYLHAEALLRFYFGLTEADLEAMDGDDFITRYKQMEYAINFDAKRKNLEKGQKMYMPL